MDPALSPTLEHFSYYIGGANERTQNPLRFLLTLAGQCQFLSKHSSLKLKTGSLLLLGSNEAYQIHQQSPDFYCNLLDIGLRSGAQIAFADLAEICCRIQQNLADNGNAILMTDKLSAHQRMVELLQVYMGSQSLDKSLLICYSLYSLIKNAERNLQDSLRQYPYNRHISQSLRYIHENYTESISAQDVAEEVGIHVNYLHSIFLKHTGKTLLEYINELRIAYAKELLAGTTLSIETIALRCSYENSKYFFRIFKKLTGTSPNAYRKSYNLTPRLGNGQYIITNNDRPVLIGTRGEHESI